MTSPRGYLLIEALVAGAVISLTLLSALTFVAQARVEAKGAGNRAQAIQLARGQAELMASALPTNALSQGSLPVVGMPGFDMEFTTATTSLAGVPTLDTRDLTVIVEYPCAKGSREDNEAQPANDGRATVTVHRTWVDDP